MKSKITGILLAAVLSVSIVLIPVSGAGNNYAEPATEAELDEAGIIKSRAGAEAQIINGTLYVWGWNNLGRLGIEKMVNPDTKEEVIVNQQDIVPWPTPIDQSQFGNSPVVQFFSEWYTSFAITKKGELYGWGNDQFHLIDPHGESLVKTPKRLDAFTGKTVLDIEMCWSGTIAVKAKESDGTINWYLWGRNYCGEGGNGTTEPISEPVVFRVANETIKQIVCSEYTTAILTQSGKVYTVGQNTLGKIGNNYGLAQQEPATNLTEDRNLSNVLSPYLIDFGGKTIQQIVTNYRAFSAIDNEGCVWSWGSGGFRGGLGLGKEEDSAIKGDQVIQMIGKPVKIFGKESRNLNTATKTARRLFPSGDAFAVLCTDNSVYGWGYNKGYRFYDGVDQETYSEGYPYPNQILESVSQKETVLNLVDDHYSYFVMTRSGNSYFIGSNEQGAQGVGTTTGNVSASNSTEPVNSPTLPPVKPTTLNKVYLDIVYQDRENTGALKTVTGAAGVPTTAKVDAGQKFTVKVYFEDFAKLDQFTLPIKFSTDTGGSAKVVYKAGAGDEEYKAYAGDVNEPLDGSNIPAFGANTGITSNVRDSVWEGGQLFHNSQYPRVNNETGYVSVYGKTTVNNAPIKGKQLMFSIDFIGTENGDITFSIMDEDMTLNGGDPVLALANRGAEWQVVRLLNAGEGLDLESYFSFNDDYAQYFPKVNSVVTMLNSMALTFLYNKDGKRYDVQDTAEVEKAGDSAQKRTYYSIDKSNTTTNYVVQTVPAPSNATYANVDSWEVAFDSFSGLNPADKQVNDYIEIISEGTKSLTFKMPENKLTTKNGYFVITAKKGDLKIDPIYVQVASMAPPGSVKIAAADKGLSPFLVNEAVAGLDLESTHTFDAVVDDSTTNTGNTNVTWTLYNCVTQKDGSVTETAIAADDLTAAASIVSTTNTNDGADGKFGKSALVKMQRTTPDGSFVKLVVASTADGSVKDEATFRVELLAIGLVADETMYVGPRMSRRISISADPYDAYEPEYDIRVSQDSPAATSDHGSYITVGANGTVSTGNEYYDGDEDIYDELIITEKKSDVYYSGLADGNKKTVKKVKVYVKNIVPPPDMDVAAQNNVGRSNDRLIFTADLKEGDGLKIYKKFMDETSIAETYGSLTASQIVVLKEGYVFADGLEDTGGTAGYLVTRTGGSFTQVPVNYSAEPCMLKGYARLEGKLSNSAQNTKITVEIQGLRDADGNPIPAKYVQDETGYFEFENYVPVGTYTLKLSRDLYMTRYVTLTVTASRTSEDIVVSTLDNPIYLAPGDLGSPKNGKLDPAEFNSYMYSWFGATRTRSNSAQFDEYNFAELASGDSVIGMQDAGLLLRYYNRDGIYKEWAVKQ